jgi:predicted DNA binding protein
MKMFGWCNRQHDIFEVILGKPEEYHAIMKELSKIGEIVEESSDQHRIHVLSRKCGCTSDNSIGINIEALNLLHIQPEIYEKGWEYYRIIAFRHEDLNKLWQLLEKKGFVIEIVKKAPFDGFVASSLTLTADSLFSNLTEKQVDALLTAYNHGYYSLPRNASVTKIAEKRRIPRTTFQEHLQKAESKVLVSLVPYIHLLKISKNKTHNC